MSVVSLLRPVINLGWERAARFSCWQRLGRGGEDVEERREEDGK